MDKTKINRVISDRLRTFLDSNGVSGEIRPETPIFGKNSPLDSIQLVSLVVDIEEGIHEAFGVEVTLVNQKAMSQHHSPFRDVRSLCEYVETLLLESPHGS